MKNTFRKQKSIPLGERTTTIFTIGDNAYISYDGKHTQSVTIDKIYSDRVDVILNGNVHQFLNVEVKLDPIDACKNNVR